MAKTDRILPSEGYSDICRVLVRQLIAIEQSLDYRQFDAAFGKIDAVRRLLDLLEKEAHKAREVHDRPHRHTRSNTHELWPPLEDQAYYRWRRRNAYIKARERSSDIKR